ncbi:nickel/cobalt transporter [Halodesulfovibrio aestuarii]|uniref:nickel/cobalt transporter n=1 Tax=Halodesulfovibrio aestuarii TaxID=126333 RepID=UPI0035220405
MQKILIFTLFVLISVTTAYASPFTGGENTGHTTREHVDQTQHEAGFFALQYSILLRNVNLAQRAMRSKMSTLGHEIKTHPNGQSFWFFMLSSFLYGIIHALGPGHGKSIVFSYFLSRKGTLLKGVIMGHLLTAVHTLSAIVIVLGAYFLLDLKGSHALTSASEPLKVTSYYLIIGLGIFILLHALYEAVVRIRTNGSVKKEADNKGLITISIISGLVPCPGAALLLSFALSLNILTTGLLGTIFFTMGMGITTSLFGIISIHSRKILMHVAGKSSTAIAVLHTSFSVIAGLAIIATGWLLVATS